MRQKHVRHSLRICWECDESMFSFLFKKIPEVAAELVKEAIDQKKDVIVLDVRTKEEFSRGNIKGSMHLPLDELFSDLSVKLPNKEKIVYAYCLSGSRSAIAVEQMMTLGYTHVYSMSHGLLAWRAKGFPLDVYV